jgi:hypothetical protein
MPDDTTPSNPSPTATAVAAAKEKEPQPPKPPRTNAQRYGSLVVIAILLGAIYYVETAARFTPARSWEVTLLLLVVFCLYLGLALSRRPLGILVGPRNLMSLSRFQLVAWSIVILSAFITIAFRRILDPTVAAPLDMPMDPHLWALLGISTASLVGTPLILQKKTDKDPDPGVVQKSAAALGETVASVDSNRQGTLYANTSVWDARFTDMFEGDEVGNTAYVDIAKMQMFLFTMIIIVAFCFQVYHLLNAFAAKTITAGDLKMPVLSDGVVALLGISNAGYLGSKTADHTPVAPAKS